jgi:ADP-heptose:LPS heptosyltransferase
MPTFNRRRFAGIAIRCFLEQDHPERELVIIDDGTDPIGDMIPGDSRIRYTRLDARMLLGAKRNLACEQARGALIVHWDDDDWSAPWRLRYQSEQMAASGADICGLGRVFFFSPADSRAWEFTHAGGKRPWVYGASLCYRTDFWREHRFPEVAVGEDTRFVWAHDRARVVPLPDPRFLVAIVHDDNTSPKRIQDPRYRPKAVNEIEQLLGEDAEFYRQSQAGRRFAAPPPREPARRPEALVTSAAGIGDILRVTPLIRVLHRQGYTVDVLLRSDYPDAGRLIEGAPEVRRVFQVPGHRGGAGAPSAAPLPQNEYDVATFTTWSADLRARIRSRRALAYGRQAWASEGDTQSVERLARELGWEGELPPPFAVPSSRRFGLPAGTVALHPGCKYEWPWKKWHGFAELAKRLPSVVVIGAAEDARTDNTYFRSPFEWPSHVIDFTGRLSLPDTAALLGECAGLISNDSGLMHLGVALGVSTFGLFGITSPAREVMRSPVMFPITKGLPCEAECRKGAWGRRDCHRHLECLKALTPDEVLAKVNEVLPGLARMPLPSAAARPADSPAPVETINVAYYGWVFDASGYGHAARSYVHALHRAGINLSVVDLAGGGRAVADPLVESLVGRKIDADFHLFHGIPPYWSRRAFPLANVIAMTVWETNTMPSQWRAALNHALEVWLPCEFNTAVFARALLRPVFRLPHPILPAGPARPGDESLPADLDIGEGDFVFYCIFEWQDRKGPADTIEAFLRAFPSEPAAVLVLKANPGAARMAATTLLEIRKRVPSGARVILRCESWSEERIAALHARGNAYVSLHRGEGWNLPLFESACLGKPIIATGFSGPLDYLDPDAHCLVRHTPAPVRQRYAYYMPSMTWAQPDVDHAAELMREVLKNPGERARRSSAIAERLREDFSLESVGAAARARFVQLMRRTNPGKWERLRPREGPSGLNPPIPIPGSWYDADYYEHGLKSNWHEGYQWGSFRGLFRETAAFLAQAFPGAKSFVDAGCAKGFLVRALKEAGRECVGFDHSPWALDHAEEAARADLWEASAHTVQFRETRDVLLAFSLLESLTEDEALAFLVRARPFTRRALMAVITTREEAAQSQTAKDNDLAHITLRPRAWWHVLFLRAGWIRGGEEGFCRQHPLARRMGWEVFVYVPGSGAIPGEEP